ncbi:protein FAM8A1-like [Littorina saxatilis]|uniref:RDD domain-containing protein n=1 Tax=Littorina saxatilis TaxID=31220 RepID=A0AAN9AS54_9CAEN
MASSGDDTRKRTTTNGNPEPAAPLNTPYYQFPPQADRMQYKNAREYAQALRPWLWQYYTMSAMQQFLAMCPPPCFQTAQFPHSTPVTSGPGFQLQQPTVPPPRASQGPTIANRHASAPHRFHGIECKIPSFWRRVSAELIDFTILFYIKLVVTVVFMREMGFMDDILDYEFLENLEDIDYDRAFAITSEVIAMEIVNRLLITVFETMCLRRGIGTVGGATPGKRLMGLRVLSCSELQDLGHDRILVAPATDIGWFSAFIRSAIKNFTIAFFFPACLTVFMFKHNRAAYDVLSNTVVVETEEL